MMRLHGLSILLWLAILPVVSAQEDDIGFVPKVIHWMLGDTLSPEKPKFIAYPTIAYAPETKWEIGVSTIVVYYAKNDPTNRLSEITGFTFITLENQFGIWSDHALYTDKSKWFVLGRIRAQQYPLLYFGEGIDSSGEELAQINAASLAIRERLLRQLTGNWYLGLETDFQQLFSVDTEIFTDDPFTEPRGLERYHTLGLGLGLVYDNRHNVLNVRDGFFGETGFLFYDKLWGSDFAFNSVFFDARYFYPTKANHVLASQFYFTNVSGQVPFNQLSLMGGESLMRGYYLGRYRDNSLVASQVEYRILPFDFSERWGAAAFLSTGTVADKPLDFRMDQLKVTGGLGIRFLSFPGKDIFTRFDVAFSEDGPGFYFFVGEAF